MGDTTLSSDEDGGGGETKTTRRKYLRLGGAAAAGVLTGGAGVGSVSAQSGDILNVQDFGAVGDGTTDDTGAINSALDSAGSGDTVFLPATGNSYYVTGRESVIDINSSHDGVRLCGEGPDTRVTYGGGNAGSNVNVIALDPRNGGLENFLLDNLTLDGGLDAVEDDPNVATGVQVHGPEGNTGRNVSMRIHNVRATNCWGNGISPGSSGTIVSNCTADNNRQHGFGAKNDNTPFQDPPILFVQCLGFGNGFGGGFYGIDLSGGKATVIDSVFRDNVGNGATKVSVGANEMIYRRVRFENNEGLAFQDTGDGVNLAVFDDVIFNGHDRTFRLSNNGTYRVPSGSELIVANTGSDSRGGIFITENGSFDAEDGTVWVSGTGRGAGINDGSDGGSSSIGTYYHASNDGGAIGSENNISFGTVQEGSRTDIDGVPTADQVGAWSGGFQCEGDE